MRSMFTLFLLSLHLLHASALKPRGIILPKVDPDVDPVPVEPLEPVSEPAPDEPDQPTSGCKTGEDCSGSGETAPLPYGDPAATNPDPTEDEPIEVAEHISDILDLVTTIISLAQGSSTITTRASLPTAAVPCTSAQKVYAACSSASSGFGAYAMSVQASCLCYVQVQSDVSYNPGAFDGYISSCNNFVLGQTSISTEATGLAPALGLCSSAGPVRAAASASASTTGTGAVASGTGSSVSRASASATTASPTASTPTVQPETTGGASRDMVRGSLFVLVGLVCGNSFL